MTESRMRIFTGGENQMDTGFNLCLIILHSRKFISA